MRRDETAHRIGAPADRAIAFGPFRVHSERHLVLKNDKPIPIGARALEILIALVQEAGQLVTKDQLVARAWPNMIVEESNLRAQVAVLRKALDDGRNGARYIAAVPGRGYRFVAAISRVDDQLASAGPGGRKTNLPTRLTQMIGRADVVNILISRLRRRRFLTIVGPGGIGKTTVAIAVAAELSGSYEDGAWIVDLAHFADAALVPNVLAATLGLALTSDDPAEELTTSLRDKRILLVLDNCERVVEPSAVLAEKILKGAPCVDILTTSREPLRAEGESVHRLSPLETPPVVAGLTAAAALSFSAVELFVERAASSVDGFQLSDADAPVVADICRQLDGIALAIELAAGRVDAFGVRGVAERLDNRFRVLIGGRRTALPRHQTLNATLDWSYALLSGPERTVLRHLGAFAGGFTLESVCGIAGNTEIEKEDIPELLANLIAKSLVSAQTDMPVARYRLLDTTRAYALAKLVESTEFGTIRRRHAEYFRGLFERAMTEWETGAAGEWLASYGPETDNVRMALDWAFSSGGDATLGRALTVAAIPLWFQLSSTDECRNRVEHALASVEPAASRDTHARQIMHLYVALGLSRTFTTGLAPQAAAAWMKAFEIAESLGDREFQLEALWGLWVCQIGIGEYRAALKTAQKFCAHAESASDLVIGDRLIGVPLHCMGDHAKARRHIERTLSREAPPAKSADGIRFRFNQPLAARVILAQMLWLQGLPDRATDAARSSVEEARATGHAISLCDALAQAACLLAMFVGEWTAAEESIAILVDQSSRHALGPWKVLGQCWKGALLVKRGELGTGLRLLGNSLEELREVRFALYHTGFLSTLAEGLATAGQVARGLGVIDEALERSKQKEELWCIAELLRVKGELLLQSASRDVARAEEHFLRSHEWARRQRALSWELRTATSLAGLHRTQGRAEEARISLMAVYERFSEGFATRDLRTAKALIDELS
jgi:predicted ATPase/DNA-binding winged helix-turn-helix (wHTH) protein